MTQDPYDDWFDTEHDTNPPDVEFSDEESSTEITEVLT